MTKSRANATAEAAKGDLRAGSGTNTTTILPVGTDGSTLVANSANASGLGWGTPSQSNPVLNSAFQVWQRGTSFTAATTYTADRWYKDTNTGRTVSRQVTGDTTNLPNIQYCLRYQRDSGNALTTALNLTQSMESANSIPFAGKTVTMSFYARAGSNFSATSNVLAVYLVTGTGTDQNQRAGYTGQALPINAPVTLTTTWQRFIATGTIAATATEIATVFEYTPTGTASTNDYFEITGVQIDVGSVALPFRTYAGTLQGELSAAQRYYFVGNARWQGYNGSSTTGSRITISLPVSQRTNTQTITLSGSSFSGYSSITAEAWDNQAIVLLPTPNATGDNKFWITQFSTSAEL